MYFVPSLTIGHPETCAPILERADIVTLDDMSSLAAATGFDYCPGIWCASREVAETQARNLRGDPPDDAVDAARFGDHDNVGG